MGLTDLGSNPRPSVFDINGTLFLIAMPTSSGNPVGYRWDGNAWISNTTIINGLTAPGTYNTYRVYNNSGAYELYESTSGINVYGFNWNGSGWTSNDTLVNNVNTASFLCSYCVLNVFSLNGTKTMIAGSFSKIAMQTWNGTAWNYNASGSNDLGATDYYQYTSGTVYNQTTINYITSYNSSAYTGFAWNGTNWLYLSSLFAGILNPTGLDVQTSFSYQNALYLIVGRQDGVWYGYRWGNYNITLNYPLDDSAINKSYPPLTTSIIFNWSNVNTQGPAYHFIIAKDSNFNLITLDTVISTNTTAVSLEAGNYWWKVRYYDSTYGTYELYSNISNFTLTNTQTTSGTNIQGTVYELLSGVQSNIDQAYVEIYNATWTSTMVTGTNGYYLFQNLKNDTYWVRAYKDGYDTTVGQAITPTNGSTSTQNILMKKTLNQYVPIDHYVKFTVQTLWGTRYPGVLVSAFKGSDVIASKSGTTGTDGSVSLLLLKEQSYRITAVNASSGINTEITIIPHETEYIIVVSETVTPWWQGGSQTEIDNIHFVVTSHEINATHAHINATYNDSLAQTTAWTIYLNQTNTTNGQNPQTTLQSSSGSGNASVSFIVTGYTGKGYLVNLKATHTTFGTIYRSYGVGFKGLPNGELNFIPNIIKAMIAIGLLIFVAAMFGQTSKSQGAGVVCAVGWILLALGFFAYFDTIKIAAGLTIATIFAVIVNMSERNKQEGMT